MLLSHNAFALTCTKKQSLVCTLLPGYSSMPTETCVDNSSLINFTSSHSDSDVYIGSCSDFDIKKIKTYACNAGLRYQNPQASPESKANFFNVNIDNYTGSNLGQNYFSKTLIGSMSSIYTMAALESGPQIIEDGSSLQFHFDSDLYGAEYFVDLCVLNKNLNPERFDLNLNGKVFFSQSLFNQNNYNSSSNLTNRVDFICKNSDSSKSSTSVMSDSYFYNAEKNYNHVISPKNFCYLRHSFKENNLQKSRENSLKKVTFQTNISLSPVDETLLLSKPIDFCKIKKTSKNKFSCESLTFENQTELLSAINSIGTFDNDTYSGSCPNPCKI